jgi:hypothetical protein
MNLNHPPQLELKLPATMPAGRLARQASVNRAAWWFDRMRRIADCAMDWPPAPACHLERRKMETSSARKQQPEAMLHYG